MMENYGNKEHDDNNKNETDDKTNNTNELEITCSDITSTDILVKCEDTKNKDKNDNET